MKTTSAPTLRTASRSSGRMKRRLKKVNPLWMLTVMTVSCAAAVAGAVGTVSLMGMLESLYMGTSFVVAQLESRRRTAG
jgi:hypothetical protein